MYPSIGILFKCLDYILSGIYISESVEHQHVASANKVSHNLVTHYQLLQVEEVVKSNVLRCRAVLVVARKVRAGVNLTSSTVD